MKGKKKMQVKFMNWLCDVKFDKYIDNGRTAIELVSAKDGEDICLGEPVLMATVNVIMEPLEKDEVIIKDYSENKGILAILVKAKIISKPVRVIQTGFATCPVCKVLVAV